MRLPKFETVPLEDVPFDNLPKTRDKARPDVLVVDDEPIIADSLSMILSRSGYEVMTAYDGRSALALARADPPTLLITDVMMPGMTGIELALSLEETSPGIKVLLFSGQATTMDLLSEARELGRDFTLLSKPIHPTDMLRRVASYLRDLPVEERATAARG